VACVETGLLIGEVATRSGVSRKALRLCERHGALLHLDGSPHRWLALLPEVRHILLAVVGTTV
jgi:hypothetical protein